MQNSLLFCLFLIFVTSSLNHCDAVRCYFCDSRQHKECGEPFEAIPALEMDCDALEQRQRAGDWNGTLPGPGGYAHCRKIHQKVVTDKTYEITIRQCAFNFRSDSSPYSSADDTFRRSVFECDARYGNDLCNSTICSKMEDILVVVVVIVAVFFF